MAEILKNPLPFDTVSRVVFVASSVSTTLAFGTTALLASYTTPLSEQLTFWQKASDGRNVRTAMSSPTDDVAYRVM
jgi:hypothetical protein